MQIKTPFLSLLWTIGVLFYVSSCVPRYGAGNYISAAGYVAKPFHGRDSSKQAVYISGTGGTNFGKGYTKRERSYYGSFMAHYAYSADYLSIAAGASGFLGSYNMINNLYPRGDYGYYGFTTFLDASYDQNSRFGTWRVVGLRLATSFEKGDYFQTRKRLVEEEYLIENISSRPLSTYVGLNTEYMIQTASPFSYGMGFGTGIWWNNAEPILSQTSISLIARYKRFHLAADLISQGRQYTQRQVSFTGGQIQFGYRF